MNRGVVNPHCACTYVLEVAWSNDVPVQLRVCPDTAEGSHSQSGGHGVLTLLAAAGAATQRCQIPRDRNGRQHEAQEVKTHTAYARY